MRELRTEVRLRWKLIRPLARLVMWVAFWFGVRPVWQRMMLLELDNIVVVGFSE